MLEIHLAGKPQRRGKTLTPPHSQPAHSIPTPHQTEKPGGLLHLQTPAPNLLGRHRTPDEQISDMQYSLGQISIVLWTDWPLSREKREKKKLNNKQAAERKKDT
jgi:hypothetical protein